MKPADLITSRQYLSHIGIWPSARRLDIDGWLANFEEGNDSSIATALLEAHVHLDEEQILHAVAATIRTLSTLPRFGSATQRRAAWSAYLDNVLVSFPLAQDGDPTGSGYIFARLASDKLGFPEARVSAPERLVRSLAAASGPADILMLDDIAASGTQFSRSWTRKTQTPHGRWSLADMAEQGKITSAFYVPVIATSRAVSTIESSCSVRVLPTYVLTPDYGVLDSETRLVTEELKPYVRDFLERYGPLTGCSQYGNAGYGDLGLAISFHHGCPNNTVPVLQWSTKTKDWTPLVS